MLLQPQAVFLGRVPDDKSKFADGERSPWWQLRRTLGSGSVLLHAHLATEISPPALSVPSYCGPRIWLTVNRLPPSYTEVIAATAVADRTAQGTHRQRCPVHPEELDLLHYALVFLVVALIAAVLGFGGIAAGAAGIAKILFVVFLIMAVASFIFGYRRR